MTDGKEPTDCVGTDLDEVISKLAMLVALAGELLIRVARDSTIPGDCTVSQQGT